MTIEEIRKGALKQYKDSNTIMEEIASKKLKKKDRNKSLEQLMTDHMSKEKPL